MLRMELLFMSSILLYYIHNEVILLVKQRYLQQRLAHSFTFLYMKLLMNIVPNVYKKRHIYMHGK